MKKLFVGSMLVFAALLLINARSGSPVDLFTQVSAFRSDRPKLLSSSRDGLFALGQVANRYEPNVSLPELRAASVEEFKASLQSQSDSELKRVVIAIDKEINSRGLVQLANQSTLSSEQANRLAENVNRKAAAQLLLIERSLANIEASIEKRGS